MNGIEIISDKILSEAHQKAAAAIAEAEQAARAAACEMAERAERDAAAVLEAARLRCLDIGEKARLAAELERKKCVASEKQALIGQVFEQALEQLVNLPKEKYRALLVSLAAKAAEDGEGGELLLNARDRAEHGPAVVDALAARVKGRPLTLSDDCAAIPGGVVVRRGRVELNSALDVIVRMLSEEVAPEISRALFPQGA
jgi:vacuolar-type H+-ATPase subunit E/Vma4